MPTLLGLQAAGERGQRGLRRVVGREHRHQAAGHAPRRRVDDLAAALLAHRLQQVEGEPHRCVVVEPHQPVVVVRPLGGVGSRPPDRVTGVVDEHVDAAEPGEDVVGERVDGVGVGEVARQGSTTCRRGRRSPSRAPRARPRDARRPAPSRPRRRAGRLPRRPTPDEAPVIRIRLPAIGSPCRSELGPGSGSSESRAAGAGDLPVASWPHLFTSDVRLDRRRAAGAPSRSAGPGWCPRRSG